MDERFSAIHAAHRTSRTQKDKAGATVETITTGCVISGGGPAGMMCGFLLARAGVDVVVLEKHRDFLRDFRGDTVHPSTQQVMHELGLLDRFLQLPHAKISKVTIDFGDRHFTIGDFSHLPTVSKFIALMPQWDFLDFIAGEAKTLPNFRLMMETEARDLIASKDAKGQDRIAGVLATSPAGNLQIRAALTIAADGRTSRLRDKSGLPLRELGAPFDVLWLRLPWRAGDPVDLVGRIGPGVFFVMIYRGDYWQCAYGIPKGGHDAIKAEGINGFRNRLRQVAGFAADRADTITGFDQVKLLTVAVNRLEQWARPGLLCIGDAAHAMSPAGGVGINLAIQDAVAAANIVGPVLLKRVPKLSDLKKVQKRRQFPTVVIQAFQLFAQRVMLAPTLASTTMPKVPWVVKLLNRCPRLQRLPARFVGMGPRPEHVNLKAR
jgi:2-polyprenyl-6-methoxyphenol hydroxylase-like FAD-dependent oxidoreductase